jgi:hypothetical protein
LARHYREESSRGGGEAACHWSTGPKKSPNHATVRRAGPP